MRSSKSRSGPVVDIDCSHGGGPALFKIVPNAATESLWHGAIPAT